MSTSAGRRGALGALLDGGHLSQLTRIVGALPAVCASAIMLERPELLQDGMLNWLDLVCVPTAASRCSLTATCESAEFEHGR